MSADIRNSILKITMEDGTEILGRVESLEMTRPLYGNSLDDAYPQAISNQMVCVFDMFRVDVPKEEVEPAFDLNAMCEEALHRLTMQINGECEFHAQEVRNSFLRAYHQSNIRHQKAIGDHRVRLIDAGFWRLFLATRMDFPSHLLKPESILFKPESIKQHAKSRIQ